MSEITDQNLSSVAETLLFTLYIRAVESQRPDALLKDEKAVALVRQMDYDFARIKQIKMDEDDTVSQNHGRFPLSAWKDSGIKRL